MIRADFYFTQTLRLYFPIKGEVTIEAAGEEQELEKIKLCISFSLLLLLSYRLKIKILIF